MTHLRFLVINFLARQPEEEVAALRGLAERMTTAAAWNPLLSSPLPDKARSYH